MADATQTRTRPKPRPRPRPALKKSSVSADNSVLPGPSSPATRPSVSADEDEDVFFMRNTKRTAEEWKQLDELTKEKKKPRDDSDSERGSGDSDVTRSPRKHKQKKAKKEDGRLPRWARSNKLDLTGLVDSPLKDIENTPQSTRDGKRKQRARSRSRSKSITPPPELPAQYYQHVQNIVKQALGGSVERAPSPTVMFADESTDTIILDPELATIAKEEQLRRLNTGSSHFVVQDQGGGPENVTIKVRWTPHPLHTEQRPQLWEFKTKRHDPLRAIFVECASQAGVVLRDIYITLDGRRIFASSSPHALKVWAEVEFDACSDSTWKYIQEHGRDAPASLMSNGGLDVSVPAGGDKAASESDAGMDSSQEQDDDDKFKIIVRSKLTTKDITLTVRPTTTCGAIVTAFLKKAGLAEQYAIPTKSPKKRGGKKGLAMPSLMIDGDKMKPTAPIGEADLEDGDMVDVVGL